MGNRRRLLFLAHRIPYPPDKGEKIRAWHILDHLAGRGWEVELGCLADDPADLDHLPALRARCAAVECHLTGGRLRSAARGLWRLRPGMPLTLGWFHHPGLHAWAGRGLAAGRYDAVFVYSSAMAPYAMGEAAAATARLAGRRVLDMVDVDSEKWRAYAAVARAPMRQVFAREARALLAFERRAAPGCIATCSRASARSAATRPSWSASSSARTSFPAASSGGSAWRASAGAASAPT